MKFKADFKVVPARLVAVCQGVDFIDGKSLPCVKLAFIIRDGKGYCPFHARELKNKS